MKEGLLFPLVSRERQPQASKDSIGNQAIVIIETNGECQGAKHPVGQQQTQDDTGQLGPDKN
jgi:hypothetical protein